MKTSRLTTLFTLLVLFLVGMIPAHAFAQLEGTYQVIIKKQEEKKQSRWTLAEWLALKERHRQMDVWLAKNSQSSPFEFYLDLASRSEGLTLESMPDQTRNRGALSGGFAAYATIAGLRGSYESETSGEGAARAVSSGSFNLRVLGKAMQDSNLNLEYGVRGLVLEPAGAARENFQSQFGGGTLTLYLTKHLGLDGSFHKILKSAEASSGRAVEGDLSQGSVFIDFSFVRVFGTWRREQLRFSNQSVTDTETREGFGGGLRFFF